MIKLSKQEKQNFINQKQAEFHLNNLEINKINFQKTLKKEFESQLELSDENNLINWHKNAKIPNTKVEDFKERICETKSGKILMGIRFLGMDISKPFVDIWTSFPIEKELKNIVNLAKKSFQIFKPKQVRFWANPESDLWKKNQVHICQNYLLGDIEKICSTGTPINFQNIDLELIKGNEFYNWYKKLYDDFHNINPKLKAFVTINSKDIFEDSIKQKLCYYIKYKNEKIGIIAAEKEEYFGSASLYMNEIIITNKFKGKKLATASQRKLIELNKNDFKYIWGSIDQKNIPSTKNALKIGRKIVSSEILFPI